MTTLAQRISMAPPPPQRQKPTQSDRDRDREHDERRYQEAVREVEELETLARAYGCYHPAHE